MTTYPEVQARMLRTDPGRPLLTWYDGHDEGRAGERVELSVTTYANWVAKAAGLLVDEHGLERGDRLRIDLPPHWLGVVFLGAAWSAGLVVCDEEEPDAVVCGPSGLERWTAYAASRPVLACSLLPLGVRFADPLPPDVHDVGLEIWGQPDGWAAFDPPEPADLAVDLGGATIAQGQLWSAAAVGDLLADGGRLLSTRDPVSTAGIATIAEPFARGGSLVLVAGATADRLEEVAAAERITARVA